MNIEPIDQTNGISLAQKPNSPEALRKAATQFEAVLLMHLTSALNNTSGDDEDALFGNDGGAGLAKQLFSEQLATTMAQSGGVGLSDMILQQFGGAAVKSTPGKIKGLSEAMSAISKASNGISADEASMDGATDAVDTRGLSGSFKLPSVNNPDDVQVISTFEDQLRSEGIDDSLKNLILDGKVVNTTRARIVPDQPVNQVTGNTIEPFRISFDGPKKDVAFSIPVSGRISSGFGNRFHPIDKRVKFHAGLDIAVPKGTEVGAAADGVVTFAGPSGGYGNLVIVKHPDGRETRYGHLSRLMVSVDAEVKAGEPIALSGSTGKSTGPHLHFEVRENGQAVDPAKIISNVLSKNVEK